MARFLMYVYCKFLSFISFLMLSQQMAHFSNWSDKNIRYKDNNTLGDRLVLPILFTIYFITNHQKCQRQQRYWAWFQYMGKLFRALLFLALYLSAFDLLSILLSFNSIYCQIVKETPKFTNERIQKYKLLNDLLQEVSKYNWSSLIELGRNLSLCF